LFPYLAKNGVDRPQGLLDAIDDVVHVLLVEHHVGAGAQPAHVASDEVLPRVGHGRVRGGDGTRDVLVQVEAVERHPAGQEEVDQHERVVVGKVDVAVVWGVVGAVVWGVVGAVPREVNTLPAHVECVLGLEGDVRDRPGRVVLACQQLLGLDLPDPHHVRPEQRRAADVVAWWWK
jgi:hypothetical protein